MAKREAFNGKPYAGNPHVLFDEGGGHIGNAEARVSTLQKAKKTEDVDELKPCVSVVIPVFNAAAFLHDCIASLRAQTLADSEFVFVDDGSTDASVSILNEYATRDKRIVILQQENQGAGVARNRALDIARGEWIAFLDPDDCYPSQETLAHLVSAARKNSVDICGGSLRTMNTEGEVVQKTHSRDNAGYLFRSDGLLEYSDYQFEYGYWRFIYRRSFLDRNKLRFPALRRFQDPPFMVAAFTAAGRFYSLREDTYCCREGQGFKNVDWKADDFLRAWHYLKGLCQVLSIASREGYDELFARTYRRMFAGGGKFLWTDEYFPNLRPRMTTILDDFIPKVSIVIPVYNVEKFVGETLDSVLQQTYPNLEIICVNDGSTDNSLDVINSYAPRFNNAKRLYIHSQANGGLSAARNVGMSMATGKYIYFLDSDDKIVPEAITELVTVCECNQLDQVIFSCDVFITDETESLKRQAASFLQYYKVEQSLCGKVMRGDMLFKSLIDSGHFYATQQLRFYKLDLLKAHGCSFPYGLLHEDNYFAPLSLRWAERAMIVNKRYFQRRVRNGSIMTSTGDRSPRLHGLFGVIVAICVNKDFWTGSEHFRAALGRFVFTLCRVLGWHCYHTPSEKWIDAVRDVIVANKMGDERITSEFILPLACNLFQECDRANRVEKKFEAKLKDANRLIATKNKQIEGMSMEVAALKSSEAYRVGMFVTWPARKVYGGIKCLRENGVKYTVKHAIGKVLRLFGAKVKW